MMTQDGLRTWGDPQGSLFGEYPPSFHRPTADVDRIGVVDVGSNSVRMVVFEGGRRCPAMVYNERAICGLGADLNRTGRLSAQGRERCLLALNRFMSLAPGLKIGALVGVATAAIREAEDGPAFRDEIEARTGIRLDIASGADEARLAAQGVLFGTPDADGVVVDLGGASMELSAVKSGRVGAGVSTPLGPLRLGDLFGRTGEVRALIGETLAPHASIGEGGRLYLVGGAWRAFGRVHLFRSDHPMNVLHEFTFTPEDARQTAAWLLTAGDEAVAGVPGLSSSRRSVLRYAALLLEGLIETLHPSEVMISGFGLREGVCFEYLTDAIRAQDPLLSSCVGHEHTRARAPGFGAELADWLLAAVPATDPREERLIHAACHLVDVNWRAHPDYRATSCLDSVTRVNVSGAGHRGRAFIGACLLTRYKGGRKILSQHPVMQTLLTEDERQRAAAIGSVMRLGATLAGAIPGYLARIALENTGEALILRAGEDCALANGEEVSKRLSQAQRALGLGGG